MKSSTHQGGMHLGTNMVLLLSRNDFNKKSCILYFEASKTKMNNSNHLRGMYLDHGCYYELA